MAVPSPAETEYARRLYDTEVSCIDDDLRGLFAQLRRRGFLDHAAIVVTADHGEEFGEHGLMGHGSTLFDEVLRVTLVIVAPGVPAGTIIHEPVSLVDIAPTLLELIGLSPEPAFEGRSLASALRGAPAAEPHAVLAELFRPNEVSLLQRHERALMHGRWKLLIAANGVPPEVYDLDTDPEEQHPSSMVSAERRSATSTTSEDHPLTVPFQRLRASLYDALIVGMTRAWYRAVLERLPAGARVLDVGIGTGSALVANADLVVARNLRIVGVDVDSAYVTRCRARVAAARLADRIEVRLESVYDHRGIAYDAVYFSGSFMLLPDPAGALRHVAALLAPAGRVWFTHTVEHAPSPVLERLKPLLRRVTTIDFGRVTYEAAFRAVLAAAGMSLDELVVLRSGPRRSAVLAVARPPAAAARLRGMEA